MVVVVVHLVVGIVHLVVVVVHLVVGIVHLVAGVVHLVVGIVQLVVAVVHLVARIVHLVCVEAVWVLVPVLGHVPEGVLRLLLLLAVGLRVSRPSLLLLVLVQGRPGVGGGGVRVVQAAVQGGRVAAGRQEGEEKLKKWLGFYELTLIDPFLKTV